MGDGKNGDAGNPVREISLMPTITSLLKPTAAYVGAELRDYVKTTMEEWKAKRRERNLAEHLEGVRKKLAADPPTSSQDRPTFEQLDLFSSWMESAQDVDPENVELSEIWQNLLARAARGGRTSGEIVEAVKSLTPREAEFLSEFHVRVRSEWHPVVGALMGFSGVVHARNRYLARALESKGILERDYNYLIYVTTILGGLGVVTYFSLPYLFSPNGVFPLPWKPEWILGATIGIVLGGIAIYLPNTLARWRFSWLGGEILRLVRGRPSTTS